MRSMHLGRNACFLFTRVLSTHFLGGSSILCKTYLCFIYTGVHKHPPTHTFSHTGLEFYFFDDSIVWAVSIVQFSRSRDRPLPTERGASAWCRFIHPFHHHVLNTPCRCHARSQWVGFLGTSLPTDVWNCTCQNCSFPIKPKLSTFKYLRKIILYIVCCF